MAKRPVINPVLKLLKSPTPKTVPGGGKNAKGIKDASLDSKRLQLSNSIETINNGRH